LIDVPHLIFVWLFSLSLFYREFKLTLVHIVIAILYCLPILAVRLAQFGVFEEIKYWWVLTANIFSFMLMAHLIFVALKGRADDLSEKRRYSRVCFVIAISTIAILTAISEVWIVGTHREYIGTVKTVIIFPGIVWICFWLLRFSQKALDFEPKVDVNHNLSHKDKLLIADLEEAMTVKKLYLKPSIAIDYLAKSLGVATHRLRRLINQELGYKNFSTYVNAYRIESVKAELSDPANKDTPILTVALNNGFASLSPFNRAFLAKEGVTPSEYRRKCELNTK
jgi:AraC-like DNA-binding protein